MPTIPIVAAWIWSFAKVIIFFVPPGLLLYVLSRIVRHSISLYGQLIESSDDRLRYRFAVQNNEDVPWAKRTNMMLRSRNAGARFTARPVVYAGCNEFITTMNPDSKEWCLLFAELPAYDTWMVDLETNAAAREVTLELEETDTSFAWLRLLSHSRLSIGPDRQSALVGGGSSPDAMWAAATILLALATYGIFVYSRCPLQCASPWDGPVTLTIALAGILLFLAIRRKAPPIIQGHWTPSSERHAPPADAAEL